MVASPSCPPMPLQTCARKRNDCVLGGQRVGNLTPPHAPGMPSRRAMGEAKQSVSSQGPRAGALRLTIKNGLPVTLVEAQKKQWRQRTGPYTWGVTNKNDQCWQLLAGS